METARANHTRGDQPDLVIYKVEELFEFAQSALPRSAAMLSEKHLGQPIKSQGSSAKINMTEKQRARKSFDK